MSDMLAARLFGVGDIRVERIAMPAGPGPGEVLIAIEAAGICGSDLHNFRTGQWISRAPVTPGHELAGTVLEVGAGVEGFATGDRVVADSRFWCGNCRRCAAGEHQLCEQLGFVGEVCDGGFAERAMLPARLLYKAPDGLDAAVAAMAEPLAVALHAIARLGAPAGAAVMVIGGGPIGGLVALALTARGHAVTIVERSDARLALVAGVTGAAPAAIADLSAGETRHVVDATGSTAVLAELVATAPPGSRIALVGIGHGAISLDPNVLVERELTLTGCHAFAGELAEAVALLSSLGDRMQALIGDEIGIADIPDAYAALIAGRARGLKTIIRPGIAA